MAESIWWKQRGGAGAGSGPGHGADLLTAAHHDVVVVGAGLTGLTTALLLAEAGLSVLVVEARHAGAVTSGRTTGKVSALQGTLLSSAARSARWESVQAYVGSTLAAQEWLRQRAGDLGLALQERPALTWGEGPGGVEAVEREHRVALDLGLPVELVEDPDLPVPADRAVVLRDQLQLDPVDLVTGLAAAYTAAGGHLVAGWRMRRVRQRKDRVRVQLHPTDGGAATEVSARHVVLATGAPTVDRRLHFARVTAQRSYLLAFEVGEEPVEMALAASGPSRSFRGARIGGRPVLLAGGSGHPTARGGREPGQADAVRAWVDEHWSGARELGRWSAQDYSTTDHLPLVGSLGGASPDVHLATGFNKWGISSGIAAALALRGTLTGEPVGWADPLYDRPWRWRDAPALAAVQAGVVRGGAEALVRAVDPRTRTPQRAVSGDCAVAPVCTHLGGPLRWNDLEGSYDCPLHGSRFGPDGEVLEGPATRPLLRRRRD